MRPLDESVLRRAAFEWWRSLTGSGWMWLWSAVVGVAAVGVGSYLGYGDHSRAAVVAIGVGSAAAGLVIAMLSSFVLQVIDAPRKQRDEARNAYSSAANELQTLIDEREDRRAALKIEFEYDGRLFVYIGNSGLTISPAWLQLFVPKLPRLQAQRVDPSVAGASAEVTESVMHGVAGSYRWSEFDLSLPGAGTTIGFEFDIGRVGAPTTILFGLNADELGGWIWRSPTIHPLEGDEYDWDDDDE